jgi:hypothetical protein
MRASPMHPDIVKLANQLINVLHQLEQHVAPADLNGKRLLHEANAHIREITSAVEKSA